MSSVSEDHLTAVFSGCVSCVLCCIPPPPPPLWALLLALRWSGVMGQTPLSFSRLRRVVFSLCPEAWAILTVGCSYVSFIRLTNFCFSFAENFYHEWCWIISSVFPALLKWLVFILLLWWIILTRFQMLNELYILRLALFGPGVLQFLLLNLNC